MRPAARDPRPVKCWPFPAHGATVSTREAAALLGVTRRTIERMAAAGEIRATGAGNDRRINAGDLFIRAFHSTLPGDPVGARSRVPLEQMNREAAARLGVTSFRSAGVVTVAPRR